MGVPEAHRDMVAASWRDREPPLYGRLDLAYDGAGPAKLLEYNADTPTALYESAAFQWLWLEDMRASGALDPDDDQFNGIHEALVARFGAMLAQGDHSTSPRPGTSRRISRRSNTWPGPPRRPGSSPTTWPSRTSA